MGTHLFEPVRISQTPHGLSLQALSHTSTEGSPIGMSPTMAGVARMGRMYRSKVLVKWLAVLKRESISRV